MDYIELVAMWIPYPFKLVFVFFINSGDRQEGNTDIEHATSR